MPTTTATRPRPRLTRPVRGRVLGGVAAGLADQLGAPPRWVRVALVAVAVGTGGAGVLGYLLLWALVPSAGPAPTTPGRPAAEARSGLRWDELRQSQQLPQLAGGVALLSVGGSLLGQRAGLDVGPVTTTAVAVLVCGVGLAWGQLDTTERTRWLSSAGGDTAPGLVRLGLGFALALVGIVLLVTGQVDAAALRAGVLAAAAVLAGAALLLAPWWLRLWRDLVAERSARIRATERAEIAAHLHDSVLQTLSLIQRRSADPLEVSRLARAQERQLRTWLYATGQDAVVDEAPTLADAVRVAVAEIEDSHGAAVEVVAVGDGLLDDGRRALVLALREAVLNAVRHGAPPVSVYVEASDDGVEAFVRDHGAGVDIEGVPADRLGIRESVVGRMERHGGLATVRRAPGGGTEVALRLGSTVREADR